MPKLSQVVGIKNESVIVRSDEYEFRRKLMESLKNKLSNSLIPKYSIDNSFKPSLFLLKKMR